MSRRKERERRAMRHLESIHGGFQNETMGIWKSTNLSWNDLPRHGIISAYLDLYLPIRRCRISCHSHQQHILSTKSLLLPIPLVTIYQHHNPSISSNHTLNKRRRHCLLLDLLSSLSLNHDIVPTSVPVQPNSLKKSRSRKNH